MVWCLRLALKKLTPLQASDPGLVTKSSSWCELRVFCHFPVWDFRGIPFHTVPQTESESLYTWTFFFQNWDTNSACHPMPVVFWFWLAFCLSFLGSIHKICRFYRSEKLRKNRLGMCLSCSSMQQKEERTKLECLAALCRTLLHPQLDVEPAGRRCAWNIQK